MLKLEIIALHKHWCTADAVKQFVSSRIPVVAKLDKTLEDLGQQHSIFLRMSVWYALVYVVVEGYLNLKPNDGAIDTLLGESAKVENLRRFRNAVFHYQDDLFSSKLSAFLETPDSEIWVRELNDAFKNFFERCLPIQMFIAEVRGDQSGR